MLGLYVHIPFCKRKCFYCDFVSVAYENSLVDNYLNSLQKEATKYSNEKIDTVYIGGGTPSVLSVVQLEKLISIIKSTFDITNLQEFTIELNPESTTKEKLELLYKSKVTRISFGLQTTFDDKLEKLGRLHNYTKFKEAYYCAKEVGFDNISVDLMYGIPTQSLEDWKVSLNEVLKLDSQHISLYPLTVEPNTPFYNQKVEPNTDLQSNMFKVACDFLKSSGFEHYEISNWAKNKHYSKHNKLYWLNNEYVGLGASASSYYKRYRYKNETNVSKYISNIESNKEVVIEKEYIDDDLYSKETIMLGLRLSEGVDVKFFDNQQDVLNKYIENKMLVVKNNKVSLSEDAIFVSNSIISEFI